MLNQEKKMFYFYFCDEKFIKTTGRSSKQINQNSLIPWHDLLTLVYSLDLIWGSVNSTIEQNNDLYNIPEHMHYICHSYITPNLR